MLFAEDWEDQDKRREMDHLIMQWLKSSHATMSNRFGKLFERWLQVCCFATFQASDSTWRGGTSPMKPSTQHLEEFTSQLKEYQSWVNGLQQTYEELNLE